MFNKVAAVLFHLSPLVPFFFGYRYVGCALILLVGLAYVKTNKLNAQLKEASVGSSAVDRDLRSLIRARDFWRRLTFLPSA